MLQRCESCKHSPLAAILGLAGASPAEDKEYAKFVSDTGFDYTRDLNAVAIALWPCGLEVLLEKHR